MTATARLRIIDENGKPVPNAEVRGSWSRSGQLEIRQATTHTDRKGRAVFPQTFEDAYKQTVFMFCISGVDHRGYIYDPGPAGPGCDSATVR